ncbi:ASCH domain-containing protein [Shouchella rhizosphaerae]|uniref:ASCH domain-containing protein n=1 Tax=Shouchella rhizosphaerae TaxID=866786 RepID=UPI003F82009F
MENRSAAALWQSFKSRSQHVPDHYEAWAFGNTEEMADELAELVLAGKKTATSSNYTLYELEQEPLPKVGQHHVLLNGKGEAVAVIMTTAVTVIPYNQVTEEHAFLEGEGDRSLAYWQNVHEPFFTQELETHGLAFHPDIPVLCEQFKVVYRR